MRTMGNQGRLPEDLRNHLEATGLLEEFVALPTDERAYLLEWLETATSDDHRSRRVKLVVESIKRGSDT